MAEVWLMEHGLLEDAKAHEKAHKAFMKRKTAPNTKSSIAGGRTTETVFGRD